MIHPMEGMCLVEMLAPESESHGGLSIPGVAQGKSVYGIVRQVGHWKKDRNGFHRLPEFRVGDKVIIGAYSGTQIGRSFGERHKIVKQSQVMAVVSE